MCIRIYVPTIAMIIVCVIIISCLHGCFHASWLASLLALQAECEALRAEAVKWEDNAKSLGGMQDVSTLNLCLYAVIC